MTSPLLQKAEQTLSLALKHGASEAEAYLESGQKTSISSRNAELDTVETAWTHGLGLRVFVDHRCGFAYTSDLSGESIDRLADQAVALAKLATPDPHAELPAGAPVPSVDSIFDPKLACLTAPEKVKMVLALEDRVRAMDPRIKITEFAMYRDAVGETVIRNSRGVNVQFRETGMGMTIGAIAEGGGDRNLAWGSNGARFLEDFSLEQVAREAVETATLPLAGAPVESQRCPILMDFPVVEEFLTYIAMGLSSHRIQLGQSMFAGKQGTSVATDAFTLIDDGTRPRKAGTAPADGEGVPRRPLTLIHQGRLDHLLYHTYSAHKEGRISTGHAARSYRSLPEVSFTNLFVPPGRRTKEELIRSIPRGLYMISSSNVGGISPVTGMYSVKATGVWIENGRLTRPVNRITVAGQLLDMLKGIAEISSDVREYSSGGTIAAPALLIDDMTITG